MKIPFSKRILIIDYIVAVALIVGYILLNIVNGYVSLSAMQSLMLQGYDVVSSTLPSVFNLDGFGVILGIWIGQTGVSSTAYYIMIRAEHRTEICTKFVSELPQEIKDNVDMTTVLTTALSVSDN